jgi:hypothetical protein
MIQYHCKALYLTDVSLRLADGRYINFPDPQAFRCRLRTEPDRAWVFCHSVQSLARVPQQEGFSGCTHIYLAVQDSTNVIRKERVDIPNLEE